MRPWDEARAAIAAVTRPSAGGLPLTVRTRALAWWPLVALLHGAAAVLVASAVARSAPAAAGVVGVLTLELLGGGRRLGRSALVGVALRSVELWATTRLPSAGQTAALLLGPLLGRWAEVVQCHGVRPAPAVGAETLIGRAGFREFGAASLTALGVTMTVGRGLGVLIAVAAAMLVLAIRVAVVRRRAGMTPAALVASGASVEALPFVVLALLA